MGKAKVVQAAAAKVKKLSKKVDGKVGVKEVERDEFDEMAEQKLNVRQRINSGDNSKVKQRAESGGSSKTKQAKLDFKPVDKKPKRNPWSDIDSDEIYQILQVLLPPLQCHQGPNQPGLEQAR